MPNVKTVWAKCPIPETNNQVGFVQLDRTTAEALIASGKVEDPMQGEKGITMPYTNCNVVPPVVLPKVVSNIVTAPHEDTIIVTFDTDMQASNHLEKAISVTGNTVLHASVSGKVLTIIIDNDLSHGDSVTWSYNDQHPTEELTSIGGVEADNQTYGVTNNLPFDDTNFVSAKTYNGYGIEVTLTDDQGYNSIKAEWEVKVGGTVVPKHHVSGHDTNKFTVSFQASDYPTAPMKKGDVITVSHKIAGSGIIRFINEPVTNNLV